MLKFPFLVCIVAVIPIKFLFFVCFIVTILFFSGLHFENVEDLQIFLNNHEDVTFFYNPAQTEYQIDFELALGSARISGGSCYPELDSFLDSFR